MIFQSLAGRYTNSFERPNRLCSLDKWPALSIVQKSGESLIEVCFRGKLNRTDNIL